MLSDEQLDQRIVDKSAMDELTCCICYKLMISPEREPRCWPGCGHEMCKECFSKPSLRSCPHCRCERTHNFRPYPSHRTKKMVMNLKIKCKHAANGCDATPTLDSCRSHENECKYRKIACEFCDQEVLQFELEDHRNGCGGRQADCPGSKYGCNHEVTVAQLEQHLKECKAYAAFQEILQLRAEMNVLKGSSTEPELLEEKNEEEMKNEADVEEDVEADVEMEEPADPEPAHDAPADPEPVNHAPPVRNVEPDQPQARNPEQPALLADYGRGRNVPNRGGWNPDRRNRRAQYGRPNAMPQIRCPEVYRRYMMPRPNGNRPPIPNRRVINPNMFPAAAAAAVPRVVHIGQQAARPSPPPRNRAAAPWYSAERQPSENPPAQAAEPVPAPQPAAREQPQGRRDRQRRLNLNAVCIHYSQGLCGRGRRCRFQHPGYNEPVNASRRTPARRAGNQPPHQPPHRQPRRQPHRPRGGWGGIYC